MGDALTLEEDLNGRDNERLARSLDEAYRKGLTGEEREQLCAASASFQRLLEREEELISQESFP